MAVEKESDTWIRVLVGAMVVLVAVILLAASIVVGVDSRTAIESRSSDQASAPATEPRPDGAGPTPTGDADVDRQLSDIATFVEEKRGLTFQKPVTVEVLADGPFQDRLFASTDKDHDDLTKQAQALQALGFVDDVSQVEQGERALLAVGVLGFYDPDSKELVVRGGSFTPMTRQTIAHELTHALDDQWFDIGNAAYDEHDDELGFGISALAEGNARRVDEAYALHLSGADKATLKQEQAAVGPPPASVPPVLVSLITAPYDYGEPLVRALLKQGDQPALDDAFKSPPRTSEQVIDVDKLFAAEGAIPVDAPPADGVVLDQGMFGELMLRLVVSQTLGQARARRASAGWGGDHYVVWQQGAEYCLRADFAADSPDDLKEMNNALDRHRGEADQLADDRTAARPCPFHVV